MVVISQILFTIFLNLFLSFISTNLIGLFIRPLVAQLLFKRMEDNPETHEIIKNEIKKTKGPYKLMSFFSLLLIIVYLYLLYKFGNIGISFIGLLLMIARIPDLFYEIETGIKVRKDKIGNIMSGIYWISYPLLYYFLYHFK